MSYAQGTTHYNFPQIAGTDRPTFADANEAFRTLDTKLYGLEGSATEVDGRLDTAEGNIVQLQGDVQTAQGTADLAKSTADTAVEQIGITNTNVSQLTTRVGNKFDSVGIADPYDTDATYSVGDVVTYNGQRYRCTTAVAVAEPFDVTKWTGEDVETVLEDVETVLEEIKSDLADTGFKVIKSVTADGVKTWATLLTELGYPTGAKECIRTVYQNGAVIFTPQQLADGTGHHYVNVVHDTNQFKITELVVGAVKARYSFVATSSGNTISDTSTAVPPSGMVISFVR